MIFRRDRPILRVMEDAFVQGVLLYARGEAAQARELFRDALAGAPGRVSAMAYVALCSTEMEEAATAAEAVRRALELDPTDPFVLYATAVVRRRDGDVQGAEAAIDQALARGGPCGEYLGLAAELRLDRGEAADALKLARRGLDLEPGNLACTIAAFGALARLGRDREAAALGEQVGIGLCPSPPQRARPVALGETQVGGGRVRLVSSAGWMALRRREPEVALEVFREALLEEPGLESAREGMAEALRERSPVFGSLVRYLVRLERPDRRGWARSILEYFAAGAITDVAIRSRRWRRFIIPLLLLRFLLTYLSTVAAPLANLLLSTRDEARDVLSPSQVREASLARLLVGTFVGAIVAIKVTGTVAAWIAMFVAMFTLTNVASTFACPEGWPRKALAGYSLALLAVGLYALVKLALWDKDWGGWGAFALFLNGSMLGTVASSLLGGVRQYGEGSS